MFSGGWPARNCCASSLPAAQVPPSSTQASGICSAVNPNCCRTSGASSSSSATVSAVFADPLLDVGRAPDLAHAELVHGGREIGATDDLVDALAADFIASGYD